MRCFGVAECGATGLERLDPGWELTATISGIQQTFASRWIVDATGRSAWFVRRHESAPNVIDRLIGLIARVELNQSTDNRLALEAVPEGWFYFAPLPGGRAVVGIHDR